MRVLIFVSTLFVGTCVGYGAVINVPSDQPTVQAGINAAGAGDTVLAQPGNYVENIDFGGRNIVLGSLFLTTRDTSYISSTILDGNSSGSVVRFVNNEDTSAAIIGFTITNGSADPGGGILCEGSEPVIAYNKIEGNYSSGNGAGIHCAFECRPRITHNTIRANISTGGAGGISCYIANAWISDNIITSNSADGGGGIGCSYCSHPTIINNVICGNTASGGAGGIGLFLSSPTICNNVISDNAADHGGAIFCAYSPGPIIAGNTMSGNSSNGDGTISCFDSDPIVEHCIISFSAGGRAVFGNPRSDVRLTCCDVFGNAGGDWVGDIADQAGLNGNFSLDPLFCDTANGDYWIDSESPCEPSNNECLMLVGALPMGCGYVCGDADGDGAIDVDDAVYLVDYVFGGGPAPVPYESGDSNCSGTVDIDDVTWLVNFIFAGGNEPCDTDGDGIPDC